MRERKIYKQLRPEERVVISSMKLMGHSTRAMGRVLCRPASTISREIRRNSCAALGYTSDTARTLHAQRRRAARPATKLNVDSVAWSVVLTLLDWKWSPQQIAATLKRVFPNQPERHVSHETIYTAIYAQPRGELRRQLVACLRQGRSTRMPRSRGNDRRGQIPEMVSIHVRPPEVTDRVMPGHWEGDFIKGAGNQSSVGVLVERSSRLVLLAHGSAAPARTPTGCCANTCPRAPTSRSIPRTSSTPSPTASTTDLALRITGIRHSRCSPRPWPVLIKLHPQFNNPGVALRS